MRENWREKEANEGRDKPFGEAGGGGGGGGGWGGSVQVSISRPSFLRS
jgi:hypothetical protein